MKRSTLKQWRRWSKRLGLIHDGGGMDGVLNNAGVTATVAQVQAVSRRCIPLTADVTDIESS